MEAPGTYHHSVMVANLADQLVKLLEQMDFLQGSAVITMILEKQNVQIFS